MLISRPTLMEVERIYKKCADSNFILLSGGIAVGKTMFAKMLAVDISCKNEKEQCIPKGGETIDKYYAEEGYLNASQKVGQYYGDKYDQALSEGKIEFVSMHVGYDYDSFVYGIQIETQGDRLAINKRERIFGAFIKKAKDNDKSNYIIILDDLNRADIPATMGDLLSALEGQGEPGSVYLGEDKITIPPNLYVIATLNPLIGKEYLDLAWYRRFIVVDIFADEKYFDMDYFTESVIESQKQKGEEGDFEKYYKMIKYENEIYRHLEILFEHNLIGINSEYSFKVNVLGHGLFLYFDPDKTLRGNMECVNDILAYKVAPLLDFYVDAGKLSEYVEPEIKAMRKLFYKDGDSEEHISITENTETGNGETTFEGFYQALKDVLFCNSLKRYPNLVYFFFAHASNKELVVRGVSPRSGKFRVFLAEDIRWIREWGEKIKVKDTRGHSGKLLGVYGRYSLFLVDKNEFKLWSGTAGVNQNDESRPAFESGDVFFIEDTFSFVNRLKKKIEERANYIQELIKIMEETT